MTRDLQRCYTVEKYDPATGSVTLYRSDSRGQPMGLQSFVRKCDPEKVWTFIDGPTTDAIRKQHRRAAKEV